MKTIVATLVLLATAISMAQDSSAGLVTVNAKGDDVRSVIHNVFQQAKKNFVLSPGVRFVLYMSLENVKFEDALTLICKNANLKVETIDGVYHISNNPPRSIATIPAVEIKDEPKPVVKKEIAKEVVKPAPATQQPKGTLPTTVLGKIVTTRLQKVDIREVFSALSRQTGIKIEVAEEVPSYKLDAFLLKTSLRYALDEITRATHLKYRLTNQLSIAVEK